MTTYRQRLDAGVYKQGAVLADNVEPTPQLETATGPELYACPDCGRKFTNEHGLKIHRTKTHGANGDA